MSEINDYEMKMCSTCLGYKKFSDFNKNKRSASGLQVRCKGCEKIYREENKQRRLKDGRDYNKTFLSNIHGYLYSRWNSIQQKCTNPNHVSYKNFGGNGVKNKFTFDQFFDYVVFDLGFNSIDKLQGKQILRKNNEGAFEKGNIEIK